MKYHAAALIIQLRFFNDDGVVVDKPLCEMTTHYDGTLSLVFSDNGECRIMGGVVDTFTQAHLKACFTEAAKHGARCVKYRHGDSESVWLRDAGNVFKRV